MPKISTADVAAPGVAANLISPDRWRVVWHDKVPTRRKREFVFIGPQEGIDGVRTFVSECAHAIGPDGPGAFNPKRDRAAAPEPAADLHELLKACVAARKGTGKYSAKTGETYGAYALRVVTQARAVLGLPPNAAVPVNALSRDLFEGIAGRDRAGGASPMMQYAPLRLLIDAWRWGYTANTEAAQRGERNRWPHLPTPPATPKDYLPRTPKYGRTIAPTLAHIDACLRHLPPKTTQGTRIAALFMRFTGLRTSQVMGIHREDIDLGARTLFVRVAKTEGERADARTVPLAAALVADPAVIGWLSLTSSGPIFRVRNHKRARPEGQRSKHATVTFREAWEAATANNETPREVWAPQGRKYARPEHAFRAAFQAHMTDARVDPDVVDFLVGHEGATVRDRHYGRDLMEKARSAVDDLPPVDWTGPVSGGHVVEFSASHRR